MIFTGIIKSVTQAPIISRMLRVFASNHRTTNVNQLQNFSNIATTPSSKYFLESDHTFWNRLPTGCRETAILFFASCTRWPKVNVDSAVLAIWPSAFFSAAV